MIYDEELILNLYIQFIYIFINNIMITFNVFE